MNKQSSESISQLLISAQDAVARKNFKQALAYCAEIFEKEPDNASAHHVLGIIAFGTNNIADAINHFHKAAEYNPENPQILYNYGSALLEAGRFTDALATLNKVFNYLPGHIPTLHKCSVIVGKMGKISVAEQMCNYILKQEPSHSGACNNLANIYKDKGQIDKALSIYEKALELMPNFTTAASNYLLCLNYIENEPHFVFEAHKKFEQRLRSFLPAPSHPGRENFKPHSPVRIGYVSGDFRIHSVGYFIEPVLQHHDKSRFSVYCYSDVSWDDTTTMRMREYASHWRSIYNRTDDETVKMIADDRIDILVDLSGHSGDNRLGVFFSRPAPVQITYLGYPNTTGLSTIDYRLTDAIADPADQDAFYTERLLRIPVCFLCFKPPDVLPDIHRNTQTENATVNFGSFNNLPKISPTVIELWSLLLKTVPGSTLTIKTKPFNDPQILQTYKDLFIQQGIIPERLRFLTHIPSKEEHLLSYNAIDIALDTYPYNGTTTTCEALLMGVPVISLCGKHHASRVGAGILSTCGLPDLITENRQEFIDRASSLAADRLRLENLHATLRDTFLHSPLCDGAGFTRRLEEVYKSILPKINT